MVCSNQVAHPIFIGDIFNQKNQSHFMRVRGVAEHKILQSFLNMCMLSAQEFCRYAYAYAYVCAHLYLYTYDWVMVIGKQERLVRRQHRRVG